MWYSAKNGCQPGFGTGRGTLQGYAGFASFSQARPHGKGEACLAGPANKLATTNYCPDVFLGRVSAAGIAAACVTCCP